MAKNEHSQKPILELRFHQDLITHQLMTGIGVGSKDFLIGAKARSGKTYCIGGLFMKYYQKYQSLNALIITPAPTETISQFTDDLFYKFSDFIDFNVTLLNQKKVDLNMDKNNIIIVSKQFIDGFLFENKLFQLPLDLIVFDENHFHGTTANAKNIISTYCSSSKKTIKVYLSATYQKPLNEWNIPDDCQFYWDIFDEQMCKKRDINGLIQKHGDDVTLFLNQENKESLLCVYDNMPELHIITNVMEKPICKSNTTLFSLTENKFNYTDKVDKLLRYIGGNKPTSIFERIKNISESQNSRTKLNNKHFTSQLWFLPYGKDMLIENVSKCLKERMLKNRVLSKYEIMIVNSKKEFKLKNAKEEIKNREIKAKQDGKSGLILLAGNQLTLGITLPFVDIVVLLTDTLSTDRLTQMMFRCMTESIHTDENDKINSGDKKIGFVVDMNIPRVLSMTSILCQQTKKQEQSVNLSSFEKIKIDYDLYTSDKSELVKRLLLSIESECSINKIK